MALGLPELAAETAASLTSELKEAEPILRGDCFQLCLTNVCTALADLRNPLVFKEHLMGYFRARLEESDTRGAAAFSQLWLPSESLVYWISAFVLVARAFGSQKEDAKLVAEAKECPASQKNT
eukprot:s575_g14.t1